jgi:carbon-monoxide dehydrogenase iron sulfur subunit
MKVFTAIEELCTGCRTCEIMCSLSRTGTINRYNARLKVSASDEGIYSPIVCRQCEQPECLEACPIPEAMSIDNETGAVVVDEEECTGCRACVNACPFDAIQVSPDGKILKCDLCEGDPVCVKYCPPRPEHSLPHLPWPAQSCLQYSESHSAGKMNNRKKSEE